RRMPGAGTSPTVPSARPIGRFLGSAGGASNRHSRIGEGCSSLCACGPKVRSWSLSVHSGLWQAVRLADYGFTAGVPIPKFALSLQHARSELVDRRELTSKTFGLAGVPAVRAETTPVEPVWVMPAKGESDDSYWRPTSSGLP